MYDWNVTVVFVIIKTDIDKGLSLLGINKNKKIAPHSKFILLLIRAIRIEHLFLFFLLLIWEIKRNVERGDKMELLIDWNIYLFIRCLGVGESAINLKINLILFLMNILNCKLTRLLACYMWFRWFENNYRNNLIWVMKKIMITKVWGQMWGN